MNKEKEKKNKRKKKDKFVKKEKDKFEVEVGEKMNNMLSTVTQKMNTQKIQNLN